MNKGVSKASGDILTWIASDDYLEKGALYYIAEVFLNRWFDLINGNCYVIEEGKTSVSVVSETVGLYRLVRFWKSYLIPPQPSIFFTKEVWQTCGPSDEKLMYSMDLQLWLRAAKMFKFTYVDVYFSYYRFHSESKSASGNGFEKFKPEWERVIINFIKHEYKWLDKVRFLKKIFKVKHQRYVKQLSVTNEIYEDIFWGKFIPTTFSDFKVAEIADAIKFSFEVNPSYLYSLNNGNLLLAAMLGINTT